MANLVLEENQAKEFTDVVGNYSFTAESATVDPVQGPKMITLKPGIRLHFRRYGLFYKKSTKDIGFHIDGPQSQDTDSNKYSIGEIDAPNAQIPNLENFYIAKTALNSGFVYLINDADPENDFYEYEIDANGKLSTITWEFNIDPVTKKYLDIRKSENDSLDYKVISQPKKFWMAYSTVQWGRDYVIDKMIKDEELRKNRMVLIDCSGVEKGTEDRNLNVVPFNELRTAHYRNHPNHNTQKDLIRAISIDEQKQDEKGDNDILEDMFIALDDPIGCALDISDILGNSIERQKAMLISIQTGRDIEVVYADILAGKTPSQPTADEQQIGALVHLAMTEYKLVYDNAKMIDEYDGGTIGNPVAWNWHMMGGGPSWQGTGIYKEKLINILGVNERKDHRKVIRALQNDLGAILESDYYKNAYVHAENGTDLNCIDGKFFIMQPLKLLAIKPHLQDKMFDLTSDEEFDRQWDYLILDYLTAEEDNPAYNVLIKTVDVGEDTIKQGIDLSNKLAAFAQASLETFADIAVKDVVVTTWTESVQKITVKGNYELLLKRLNTVHVYGEEMYEVRKYEVHEKLQSAGWRIDDGKVIAGRYVGKKDFLRWIKSQSPELVLKETSHGKHIFDIPVTKEVNEVIRTPEYNNTKVSTELGAKAQKVLDGAPFRGVVAVLQIFNIGAAYHTFSNNKNSKNIVNLVGVSAELTAATSYLAEKVLVRTVAVSSMRTISSLAYRANVVGSGVTAIMCTWEAVLSFDARDFDASAAWGGAAAAFAGVTAMIFVSTAWAGPVGWACAGIGVGLVFLAYYFTDSPIEKFFKNNVLSDEKDWEMIEGELTGAYNKRFYLNRKLINPNDDYEKYNDLKFAGATLTDFIVCSDIQVKIKRFLNEETTNTGLWDAAVWGKHESVVEGDVKIFQFVISFRQFLRTADQLAYSIYFYENGISSGSYEKLEIANLGSIKEGDDKTPPRIELDVTIPKSTTDKYKPKSQILIVCALSLGDDKFYPALLNDQHRFLGAYVDVHHSRTEKTTRVGKSTSVDFIKSNVAITPLDQLLSGKAWEN